MIARRGLLSGAAALAAYAALPAQGAVIGLDQPVFTSPARRLDQIVQRAGAWSNCKLALDAGDARSYAGGVSQTWTDLSPDARNFVRGADANAATDDWTLVGTPGSLDAGTYALHDGGDYSTKASSNGTFENGHHKNAAARGFGFLVYIGTLATGSDLYTTKAVAAASVGIRLGVDPTGALTLRVSNGSANTVITSTATISVGVWYFLGYVWTINGAGYFVINDTVEALTATVSSPSGSNAATTARIGRTGDAANFLTNGSRLIGVVGFDTAPTQASMLALSAGARRRVA